MICRYPSFDVALIKGDRGQPNATRGADVTDGRPLVQRRPELLGITSKFIMRAYRHPMHSECAFAFSLFQEQKSALQK